jgi:hypothetical protein
MGQPVEKSGSGLAQDLISGFVPIDGQDFVVMVHIFWCDQAKMTPRWYADAVATAQPGFG